MSRPDLILASTSRYRRELLQRLKVPFQAFGSAVPEDVLPGEDPATRARRLAFAKAEAVAALHPHACVIGSDQVATSRGQILDKPGTVENAQRQLASLSGQQASFHTAVCLLCPERAYRAEFVDVTIVTFRTLSAAEIDRYLEADQPFDCAGAFRSESLGVALIEAMHCQDVTGLIGLPLIRLTQALRPLGYSLP